MIKNILLLTALFVGVVSSYGQMNKVEFIEYDLDNGMHVILHQDNSTPIAVVSVMYHVGSKNENPDKTGFAHFFEHLLFEGSENIERGEYASYVENAGGVLNANTTWDRTYYYELLPSNQLELGLWLESERLLHAKVEIEGVETQREVVKEERRSRIDNQPYGGLLGALEQSMKRAYKEHPYKWSIIGSMEHLDAAEEEDYKQFYRDFYTPNNAVLSIAGDIDIAQTKELINKYFASIPVKNPDIYRPTIQEPPLSGQVRDTVYDNIQLPACVMLHRAPAQGTEDYYAVSMLNTLLSDGKSSRLRKALVDRDEKAMMVMSIPVPMEDPGVILGFNIANMGVGVEDLEAGIIEEIDKVKEELITDQEFQKLRNQIENTFVSGNARMAGIAESLANYHMYYGDANLINTELDRYLAVTKEDIRMAAQKYLNEDNRVVLHYLANESKP